MSTSLPSFMRRVAILNALWSARLGNHTERCAIDVYLLGYRGETYGGLYCSPGPVNMGLARREQPIRLAYSSDQGGLRRVQEAKHQAKGNQNRWPFVQVRWLESVDHACSRECKICGETCYRLFLILGLQLCNQMRFRYWFTFFVVTSTREPRMLVHALSRPCCTVFWWNEFSSCDSQSNQKFNYGAIV